MSTSTMNAVVKMVPNRVALDWCVAKNTVPLSMVGRANPNVCPVRPFVRNAVPIKIVVHSNANLFREVPAFANAVPRKCQCAIGTTPAPIVLPVEFHHFRVVSTWEEQ